MVRDCWELNWIQAHPTAEQKQALVSQDKQQDNMCIFIDYLLSDKEQHEHVYVAAELVIFHEGN